MPVSRPRRKVGDADRAGQVLVRDGTAPSTTVRVGGKTGGGG